MFELLVFDQVNAFLEHNKLLCTSQYGFRSGKSTLSAIDELVHNVIEAFENRGFAQATLCDLSKAFDCVTITF